MSSEISEISIENIEKVLKYLPYFEDANNTFFHLSKESSLDPYIYNIKVQEFIKILYSGNFIQSFDWIAWQDEAEKFATDEHLLKNADLTTIIILGSSRKSVGKLMSKCRIGWLQIRGKGLFCD